MSLTFQQTIPARDFEVVSALGRIKDSNDNSKISFQASKSYTYHCRFSLPRVPTEIAVGSAPILTAVALNYRWEDVNGTFTGTVTSMVPSLTRLVYIDAGAEQSNSRNLTTPANAASEGYDLTAGANINRARSTVDTQIADNEDSDYSVNYIYGITITLGSTDMVLRLYGLEIYYTQSLASGGDVTDAVITASASPSADKSGMVLPISTTSSAVIITLPQTVGAAVGSGMTYRFKVTGVGNQLNISPNAADFIRGLNLNSGGTVNKDFILATPAIGNHIDLVSDGATGWYVTSASGTWTREV